MKHYFMDVMGYLSLLIYPYKLSHFFSLLFDHIASRRFRFLTHNVRFVGTSFLCDWT